MLLVMLAVVTPSPTTSPAVNPDLVTPGIAGFIAIFAVTVATVFLIVDMTRRIRRVRYRGEAAARRKS